MNELPSKIDPCPISQSFFEIRFASDVSSEIPGLVYTAIRDRYAKDPQPAVANIPAEIRDKDPNLRFVPTDQYSNAEFRLGIGARVASVSTAPFRYPGWGAFGSEISEMLQILHNQQIIREVERVGLRYINFFPEENMWKHVNVKVLLGKHEIDTNDLYLRTSLCEGDLECVTQIAHPTFAEREGERILGSKIDLDVSCRDVPNTNPQTVSKLASRMHDLEKKQFFSQLLTDDFLAKLNPKYED